MASIDVFIQAAGIDDIILASASPEQSIRQVLAELQQPLVKSESLLIFIEDLPGPFSSDMLIEELLPLKTGDESTGDSLRLHVTHCRHVEVSVRYNAEQARRAFTPSATISRVHHWAARRAFHLSARDAAEHVLQLQGSTRRPDREVHIGTLVSGEACGIAFDLVPRKRVEG